MSESSRRSRDLWNSHAKAHLDDLMSQVRRTINGRPVEEDQITLIIDAIVRNLSIEVRDRVLDLCCGNGSLSDRIFARCDGGTGVDFSEVLIAVAKHHFESLPNRRYVCADVVEFVESSDATGGFNKALCYGSLQYLSDDAAVRLLRGLYRRFSALEVVMIGNHLDKAKLKEFYYEKAYVPGVEDDPETALGRWRSTQEFAALVNESGWKVSFERMPDEFYGKRYRYDAILTRL